MTNKNLLINPSDIRELYQIGNVDTAKLYQIIFASQYDDLKKLFNCSVYFNDIINDPDNYKELLGGGNYKYDGNNFNHVGLKTVLATLVYANLILENIINVTNYGVVNKDVDKSMSIERDERFRMYEKYIQRAQSYFENVKSFLLATNYNNFVDKCGECGNETGKNLIFDLKILKK